MTDRVYVKIKQVEESYYRLLLIVGPYNTGKTALLQEISNKLDNPLINLNKELSLLLLELTERQRVLQASKLLNEILTAQKCHIVFLDNTEILFENSLKQDPLRLLQGTARNRTIVASWNGRIVDDKLTYAISGHPEYRYYSCKELVYFNIETAS